MITRLFQTIRCWGEMIRFSHSVFALPFAMMATFLAARDAYHAGRSPHVYPAVESILLIVACMVSARSVAMTFNRIADAAIDARNPRTAGRAIPAGIISSRQAMIFALVAAACFVLCCAGFWWLQDNIYPLSLSLPVLGYLCFYSYAKRFTRWSHFILGSAIALSPLAAWIAIDPASVGWPAVLLLAAVTLWIGGFDIIYACQDIQVDQHQGLFSLPSRIGPGPALWVTRGAHAGTVVLLALLIPLANLGWIYAIGLGLITMLLVMENAIVHPQDLSRVNVAFFHLNGPVGVLLALMTIVDCLVRSPAVR